jgi:membrane fusion protein, multidrug efflux system
MKRIVIWLLAAVGLSGAGWFGWQAQQKAAAPQLQATAETAKGASVPASAGTAPSATPGAKGAAGAGGGPPRGPVGVEVAKVQTKALADEISAVGTLRAAESVLLKPEVAGRIERLQFVDGARVAKGAMLVQLDAVVAAAEAEQARAELGLSQANFQRTQDLFAKNFVSERARDEAGANLKVLEAKLKVAQAKLSKSQIRAPFAGVLGLRNISVGDYVREGAELVLIEDTSAMKVDLRLPEKFIGQMRPGQSLAISIDAIPGKKFPAKIQTIDSQVDANGRSLIVRTRIPNDGATLRTGMFARAAVVLQEKPNALVIPEEAIVPLGNDLIVYRVLDGKAMRTPVKTGMRQAGVVEIVEGLSLDEVVIVAGQIKLPRDAMEVRIVDPNARKGPPGAGKGAERKAEAKP